MLQYLKLILKISVLVKTKSSAMANVWMQGSLAMGDVMIMMCIQFIVRKNKYANLKLLFVEENAKILKDLQFMLTITKDMDLQHIVLIWHLLIAFLKDLSWIGLITFAMECVYPLSFPATILASTMYL